MTFTFDKPSPACGLRAHPTSLVSLPGFGLSIRDGGHEVMHPALFLAPITLPLEPHHNLLHHYLLLRLPRLTPFRSPRNGGLSLQF